MPAFPFQVMVTNPLNGANPLSLMNIYLLCGLGADERLFGNLDLSEHRVTAVKWIRPLTNEPIEAYAQRLVPQIDRADPVLLGVSFGGMMAVEIANILPVAKVVLISSCERSSEIPALYKVAGKLRLNRLIPGAFFKHSHRLMNWVMGVTDPERRNLLADMLKKTDEHFLFWAIDKVVTWTNNKVPPNVVRIHGSADKVLPMTRVDYQISRGGHLIVANRAQEMNKILWKILFLAACESDLLLSNHREI